MQHRFLSIKKENRKKRMGGLRIRMGAVRIRMGALKTDFFRGPLVTLGWLGGSNGPTSKLEGDMIFSNLYSMS